MNGGGGSLLSILNLSQ
jgi:hypothetical protein